MNTKGLGILCKQCLHCLYYDEYQTSNGAIPRCELDEICLSLGPKGMITDDECHACRNAVVPTPSSKMNE